MFTDTGLSLLILFCDGSKTKSHFTLDHVFNIFKWNTASCGSGQLIESASQEPFTSCPWKVVLAVCPAERWIVVQWILRRLNRSWQLKSFWTLQKFFLQLSSSVKINKELNLTCELLCFPDEMGFFGMFCALILCYRIMGFNLQVILMRNL